MFWQQHRTLIRQYTDTIQVLIKFIVCVDCDEMLVYRFFLGENSWAHRTAIILGAFHF